MKTCKFYLLEAYYTNFSKRKSKISIIDLQIYSFMKGKNCQPKSIALKEILVNVLFLILYLYDIINFEYNCYANGYLLFQQV